MSCGPVLAWVPRNGSAPNAGRCVLEFNRANYKGRHTKTSGYCNHGWKNSDRKLITLSETATDDCVDCDEVLHAIGPNQWDIQAWINSMGNNHPLFVLAEVAT